MNIRALLLLTIIWSPFSCGGQHAATSDSGDQILNFSAHSACDALAKTLHEVYHYHYIYDRAKAAQLDVSIIESSIRIEYNEQPSKKHLRMLLAGNCQPMYDFLNFTNDEQKLRLIRQVLSAVLRSLDPHSLYVPPSQVASFIKSREGKTIKSFGFRTFIAKRQLYYHRLKQLLRSSNALLEPYQDIVEPLDELTVIEVYREGSAKQAGVEQADRIRSINGSPINNYDVPEILTAFSADSLSLEITRQDPGRINQTIKVAMEAREAKRSAIGGWYIRDNILYLPIRHFGHDTQEDSGAFDEIAVLLKKLDDNLEGVLIDLSGNPGGYVDQAAKIAGLFLSANQLFCFYMRGQKTPEQCYEDKDGVAYLTNTPMSVLIDNQTASAAELLAATLVDYKRGMLIGERSYGKFSAQNYFQLGPKTLIEGYLIITTSMAFTSSGLNANGEGLSPSLLIQDPISDDLRQLIHEQDASVVFREEDHGSTVIASAQNNHTMQTISAKLADWQPTDCDWNHLPCDQLGGLALLDKLIGNDISDAN